MGGIDKAVLGVLVAGMVFIPTFNFLASMIVDMFLGTLMGAYVYFKMGKS